MSTYGVRTVRKVWLVEDGYGCAGCGVLFSELWEEGTVCRLGYEVAALVTFAIDCEISFCANVEGNSL